MKTLKTLLVTSLAVVTCIMSTTQSAGINQREAAQRQSIRNGI